MIGAAKALAASLLSVAGKPCVYRRGNSSIPLDCYAGTTELLPDVSIVEVIEEFDLRDFIFPSCALIIDGAATLPHRGDQIDEYDPEAGSYLTYQVCSPLGGSELPFRFCDTGRALLRVHTKRVE